ncbi:MAG: hypothetical protein LBL41_04780 [Bifidobacteriaceae bacterium]|jgi:hypothetical protein|nr:hypothetical protein [Bifidobacteriaceae bacterium]
MVSPTAQQYLRIAWIFHSEKSKPLMQSYFLFKSNSAAEWLGLPEASQALAQHKKQQASSEVVLCVAE